jgi:pantoate--beta-alanine ligase
MSEALPTARSVAALRQQVGAWKREGRRVALIPTMGALHEGHLALVRRGREIADRTVASIFVNPTQFSPSEDFNRYPRDEAADAAKLASVGCSLLFAPTVDEMYPPGFATTVTVGPVAEPLEGSFRPSHFAGVATVVTKLLLQAQPDVACFGEKDYQQLQVVRRLVRDLDIPVAIEGVPTVREPDGLALSSRNRYLGPAERRIAATLIRVLNEVAARLQGGVAADEATRWAAETLRGAGFAKIDYVTLADPDTLAPLERLDRPGRLLAAAWLGRTRLIDNIAVPLAG